VGSSELADNAVDTAAIADGAVTAGKLASGVQTTINNNADNRVITGSGTANTLEGEASLTFSAGLLKIDDHAGNAGNGRLEFGNSGEQFIEGYDTGNAGSSSFLKFGDGSTERMRIDSSGKVGIGTTSPQAVLHVEGGSEGNLIQLSNTHTGATNSDGFVFGINSSLTYLYNRENKPTTFGTNNIERMRIQSGGGISFNGDTAAANALDDYEEGYWSPTAVDGMTIDNSLGNTNNASRRYVKVGRQVTAWFDITFASANSSANFRTRFSGLPFSPEGSGGGAAAVVIGYFTGSETDMLVGHIDGSTGLVKFYENGDAMYSYSESAGDRLAGFVTYTAT
jgi:hypothetical protein